MILSGHNNQSKTVIWHEDFTSLANSQVHDVNVTLWKSYIRDLDKQSVSFQNSWLGAKSVVDLRNIVELRGWKEGVDQAKKVIQKFEPPRLPYFKRKRIRSSQGHTLDIHRVYSGDLDHAWESTKKEQQDRLAMKGHVNVIIDIGANRNVKSSAFFWRGAVGCILSEALIKSGRNVRIIAVDCTMGAAASYTSNMDKLITSVVVKNFNQTLDLNKLFSVTAISGFYRYYFWKTELSLKCKISESFGRVSEFEVDDIDYFLDNTPCLVVSNIWNEHQANQRLQQLKTQIEGGNYDG